MATIQNTFRGRQEGLQASSSRTPSDPPSTRRPGSEKKALNFIPSLTSVSLKNTGGIRTRITNSDLKRIEGGLFKLRLRAKAKEAHPPYNPNSIPKVHGWFDASDGPSVVDLLSRQCLLCVQKRRFAAEALDVFVFFRFSAGAMFFGSQAKLLEQSRKSENFFRIDLSNSRDLFNSESLAQHF